MLEVAGVVYRRVLWMAVLAAGLCAPALSQTVSAPAAGAHEASFDVAVIRPTGERNGRNWFGLRMLPSGRFEASGITLRSLISQAYVQQDPGTTSRVTGEPKWADSDMFDITAKLGDADSAAVEKLSDDARREFIRPALRKLLEDRFQVKVHTETRVEPVYAMVQAKGGAKLKEVPAPPPLDPAAMDAFLRGRGAPNTLPPGSSFFTATEWIATAVKASTIVGPLAMFCKLTDRPVIDASGLTGLYDFKLTFDMEPDAPTKEQQIEQKLGLRVESRKAPITVYVVDAAEKPTLDGTE